MVDVNVLLHNMVPEHTVLSEKETQELLANLKITSDQLPKIRKEDPVIKVLEMVHGPIVEGQIIKITRISDSAGVSIVYRTVVDRVK